MADDEPTLNPRIRVTYEFVSVGGYHSDPMDLEGSVIQWIESGMCDRESTCREVSVEYLTAVEGEETDYPVITCCRCGAGDPEGPQPACASHGCKACKDRKATGHVDGCLYRQEGWFE
jgi:hypothetical protein